MIMRYLSLTAAAVLLSAAGAFAADMPQGPPDVVYAPDDSGTLCGSFNGRQVDRVWKPGQVAYIVAATCDDHSMARFVHDRRHWQRRENVLVYYNGGSWDRTDIRVINVPYQSQLH